MMKFLFPFILVLTACATTEVTSSGRTIRSESEYFETVDKNTQKIRTYSGFYNILDVQGTVINSAVAEAQLDQNTRLFQWTDEKFNQEKTTTENNLSSRSQFFVSFYTPERKNDDLMKNNTSWRIFLDVDGRRYEGKAKKQKNSLAEIVSLYPYHNRFATPYIFEFPVSMRSVETKQMVVTVTGPVGSGTMTFNP